MLVKKSGREKFAKSAVGLFIRKHPIISSILIGLVVGSLWGLVVVNIGKFLAFIF